MDDLGALAALSAELRAHRGLAAIAISNGAEPRAVAAELLAAWRFPALRKADGEDPSRAGAHGQPEIARSERQFYDALTDGRKAAYRDLKTMVDLLFRRRKPFDDLDPWAVDEPLDAWRQRAFRALLDQPMKAFTLGQVLASEFLDAAARKRPFLEHDRRAVRFLEAYAFSEIDAKFDEMKGSLRTALIQGVQDGLNPREVARRLAKEIDDYDTDLALISITETARAESQGRLLAYLDAGEEFVVGSSAFDERTCEHCKRLIDGKVRRASDVVGKSNYGRRAKDYLPVIPLHPRCRCLWQPFVGPRSEALRRIDAQRKAEAA